MTIGMQPVKLAAKSAKICWFGAPYSTKKSRLISNGLTICDRDPGTSPVSAVQTTATELQALQPNSKLQKSDGNALIDQDMKALNNFAALWLDWGGRRELALREVPLEAINTLMQWHLHPKCT